MEKESKRKKCSLCDEEIKVPNGDEIMIIADSVLDFRYVCDDCAECIAHQIFEKRTFKLNSEVLNSSQA